MSWWRRRRWRRVRCASRPAARRRPRRPAPGGPDRRVAPYFRPADRSRRREAVAPPTSAAPARPVLRAGSASRRRSWRAWRRPVWRPILWRPGFLRPRRRHRPSARRPGRISSFLKPRPGLRSFSSSCCPCPLAPPRAGLGSSAAGFLAPARDQRSCSFLSIHPTRRPDGARESLVQYAHNVRARLGLSIVRMRKNRRKRFETTAPRQSLRHKIERLQSNIVEITACAVMASHLAGRRRPRASLPGQNNGGPARRTSAADRFRGGDDTCGDWRGAGF